MPRFSNFMERFTPRQLLLLCCVIALIVFLLIYFTLTRLTGQKPKETPPPANVQIVVAQTDIAARTVIRENMLQLREMPSNAVPAGAVNRTTDLIGKPAKMGIVQGEIITRQKMYNSVQDAGLSGRIPPDCRAVTVGISDVTGVAGFAQPGDYVDVMVVSSQVEPNKVTSELVLQNVLLLAINKSANQASSAPPQQNNANTNNQNQGQQQGKQAASNNVKAVGNPATATLALTPEDTLKLAAKAQLGQVYLALRPFRPAVPNSEETYYSVTKASGKVAAPPAGGMPAGMPDDPTGNVQVIRGTKATVGR